MSFASKVWKLLVAIKDGLVLCFILLFFLGLYAALSYRTPAAKVHDGALLLSLSGVVVEEPQAVDPFAFVSPLGSVTQEHRAADVVRAIEGAATDDRIKVVVLDLDFFFGGGQVTLGDIGEAMDKVRAADKPVLVHALAYTADSTQLAAHASEVWLDPMGAAMIGGPGGSYLFWGGLAQEYGVTVNVFKAGRYKSAVEPYTRTEFSDDAKQDLNGVLSAIWSEWGDEVAKARPKAKLAALIADPQAATDAAGGNPAQAALNSGLVDKLGTWEEFEDRVAELAGDNEDAGTADIPFAHTAYQDWIEAEPMKTGGKAIGLVTVAGTIIDGEAGPGTAGGDRIAALLDDALDDELAALVVRVDSPGGSVTASERIRQAILRHKAKDIPIVISMGNIAASGGYWIATSGDAIFAEPATITGSIGVYGVLPTVEGTLRKFGVGVDSLGTTPLSGEPDVYAGLSPEFEAAMQGQVRSSYAQFRELVGTSRKIAPERVFELAEGRSWPGGAARQVGLVDRLGGLDAALAYAAQQAGVEGDDWHVERIESKPEGLAAFLSGLTGAESETEARRADVAGIFAARRDAAILTAFNDFGSLMAGSPVQALCTTCPVPLRMVQTEQRGPQWLRALRLLAD
ncbi:signal peptide peptidase SppA [Croceicoccus naphthovorans]|uniref:signal peptide peptidase SppA n=1 Tax=Croceicoccus naphthovorans TaxID=1348774 RepID=UPI00069DD137|nr:signal peptide peptidase SppA [Croceicoccus naphthovorans]MBB3989061.1 protease-4 [Croceicoccus naphthovorans]